MATSEAWKWLLTSSLTRNALGIPEIKSSKSGVGCRIILAKLANRRPVNLPNRAKPRPPSGGSLPAPTRPKKALRPYMGSAWAGTA
jgi:hypothetical protein